MKYFTFVMLKPDTLNRGIVPEVVSEFVKAGYKIELIDLQTVTAEKILKHYEELVVKIGEVFKKKAETAFDGKQVIPMILSSEKPDTIKAVRDLIGATDPAKAEANTIRGKYGVDSMAASMEENRFLDNLIHASDSEQSYKYESELWFGDKIKLKGIN